MWDKETPIVHSKRDTPVLIDGSGGCKFTRCYYNGHPSIMLEHADLGRPLLITGPVLAGINGWLARLVQEQKNITFQ